MKARLAPWAINEAKLAEAHAKSVAEGRTDSDTLEQAQFANIDRFFAVLNWIIHKCDVTTIQYDDLYELVNYGYSPEGAVKGGNSLKGTFAGVRFYDKELSLYSHPWIVTKSRFYDFCAALAPCQNDASCFLLADKEDRMACVALIWNLYNAYRRKANVTTLSQQSYHSLWYKICVGAAHLTQNTNKITGSAQRVSVIARE
jgi:hypothetical protein